MIFSNSKQLLSNICRCSIMQAVDYSSQYLQPAYLARRRLPLTLKKAKKLLSSVEYVMRWKRM